MSVTCEIRYKHKKGSMKFVFVLISCLSEKQEIGNMPHGKAMQGRPYPPCPTALEYYA